MKKIILSFLLLCATFSGANALSCAYVPPEGQIRNTSAIFRGTVISVTEAPFSPGISGANAPFGTKDANKSFATFKVESFWKGVTSSTVNVYGIYPWTGTVGNEISFFKVGQSYLVYANYSASTDAGSAGKLFASIDCGRTGVYSDKHYSEIVGVLGNPTFSPSPVDPIPTPVGDKCNYTNINSNLWHGNYANNRADVYTLQNFLFRHYGVLDEVNPNGFFGRLTKGYVMSFQKENGIRVTGGVGEVTRAKLKEYCGQGGGGGFCTREYMPVCGQPKMPICTGNFACAQVMPEPKTYSNKCEMQKAGADYLYQGQCKGDVVGEAPASCKVWYDGCNTCSRSYPGGPMACTMMACLITPGTIYIANSGAYCKEPFNVSGVGDTPIVKGISGPVQLSVGQKGTWTVNATSPNNTSLSYDVKWGDEEIFVGLYQSLSLKSMEVVQSSSFEHVYNRPGNYTITVTVRSQNGNTTRATQTVNVLASSVY